MILLNGNTVTEKHFPDGTLSMRVDTDVCFHDITWLYESDSEMVTLYYLTKHLRENAAGIRLDLPYVPNARMDRVKNKDEIFTLKYFAEFINSLSFDMVTVLDPHSNVSSALFDNLYISSPKNYILRAIKDINDPNLVLYFPDEGAMKRYSEMFPDTPFAFGVKNRDWRTGEIRGIIVMNEDVLKDKNVLIVDDICSKGGTFYHSAKAIKANGGREVYLYVSHCENTIFEGKLLSGEEDLIKHIYTTNSIFTMDGRSDKITVL